MKPEEAKAQAQQDLGSLVARVPRATKGWTAQIDPSRVRLTHLGKFLKLFWGALPIGGLAQLSGATRSCKCTIGCHETLQHGRDQLCRIRDGLPGFPRKRKRPTNRAFRISLTRENVCPLTGKLRSTNEDGYGSFQS
jgi:hypothetical protein